MKLFTTLQIFLEKKYFEITDAIFLFRLKKYYFCNVICLVFDVIFRTDVFL